MRAEHTRYSKDIQGDDRNYNWSVRFDQTGGCIGISQEHHEAPVGNRIERVLLSPAQVKALLAFVGAMRRLSRTLQRSER